MNEKKFLSYLKQYHQWLVAHQEKATEELAEREAHANEMQKYSKARLQSMTEDDVYNPRKTSSIGTIPKCLKSTRLCRKLMRVLTD